MGSIFNVLIMGGLALLAGRMYFSGLFHHYRAFFAFLVFDALRSAAMAPLSPSGFAYEVAWVCTEPLEWFFYVLVVLEIYALVLRDYRGLATVGRWCLMAAVSVAMAAAFLTLLAPSHPSQQSRLMTCYYVAERAVYFSLAIFLLTILALLMRYPIALTRNIVAHSLIFSVYFLSYTFLYELLTALGHRAIGVVTYSVMSVYVAVLCAWLFLLTRGGELRSRQLRPSWMPGREEDLVRQLNLFNATLQALID